MAAFRYRGREIQQKDIRFQLLNAFEHFTTVARLTNDFHVVFKR